MAGGGEENVQVDWNVTDTTSDAYVQNKPDLGLYLLLTGGTLTGQLTVPSIDFTGTLFTTQSNLGLGNVPHAAPILTGGALRFTSLGGTVTDITLPTGGGGGGGNAFDWATVGNTDRMPYDKHGLDVVIGITSVTYDTSTRNLRVRLPQVDGGDTFQEVELPDWLTAAGVADWAEDGDNSNVRILSSPAR